MDVDKLILKFIWRGIRPRILKEGNTVTGMTLLDFKTYYKTKVLKIDDIGEKINRYIIAKNRKPRNRSNKYSQLILDKRGRVIHEARQSLQQMVLEQLGTKKCRKKN